MLGNPDLVTVATRVPGGVICMISALAFHEITIQIPHEVNVALCGTEETPPGPPTDQSSYRFTGEAYTGGVDPHELDSVIARIYSQEKIILKTLKVAPSSIPVLIEGESGT